MCSKSKPILAHYFYIKPTTTLIEINCSSPFALEDLEWPPQLCSVRPSLLAWQLSREPSLAIIGTAALSTAAISNWNVPSASFNPRRGAKRPQKKWWSSEDDNFRGSLFLLSYISTSPKSSLLMKSCGRQARPRPVDNVGLFAVHLPETRGLTANGPERRQQHINLCIF